MKNSEIFKRIIGSTLYNNLKYLPLKSLLQTIPEEKILIEEQQKSDIKYALHIGEKVLSHKVTVNQYRATTLEMATTVLEGICMEIKSRPIEDSDVECIIDLLNFIMTWDRNNE